MSLLIGLIMNESLLGLERKRMGMGRLLHGGRGTEDFAALLSVRDGERYLNLVIGLEYLNFLSMCPGGLAQGELGPKGCGRNLALEGTLQQPDQLKQTGICNCRAYTD